MKDLLTIHEFSKLSGVQSSTLRYWDKIGLFTPVKRDLENNYRYYSFDQIVASNFITVLSNLNVPLKTIIEMGDKRTPEQIIRILEQQEKQLVMDLHRLQECFSVIHTRRELINKSLRVMDGFYATDDESSEDKIKIAVRRQKELAFIKGRKNKFTVGETFYRSFMEFCNESDTKEMRVNLSFPIGGYYKNLETFHSAPGVPQHFISIDPTGQSCRPSGEYLTGYTRGYFGQFGDLPSRLVAYAQKHSLKCTGPVYAVYMQDEVCRSDPSQYLVQVTVAVT